MTASDNKEKVRQGKELTHWSVSVFAKLRDQLSLPVTDETLKDKREKTKQ